MPELVLAAFESNVTMLTTATLATAVIPDITSDAVAIFTVDVVQMRELFKFTTNSDSDLRYYVDTNYWPSLNAANAMMDNISSVNPIAIVPSANKMMIAHDFIRYLALNLFGTYQGVDLFNNEVDMLQNLRVICGQGIGNTMGDILSLLSSVNLTGTNVNMVVDESGNYMTNDDSSNQNICRILFEQLIGVAPDRFANLVDSPNSQSIPFSVDDTISFKVTINPDTNQHLLTGLANPIGARSYKIKLIMKDSANVVNTSVDAGEQ